MTVVLDTSALLAIAVDGPQRAVALDALAGDPVWAASAMALTEALPAIDRLVDDRFLRLDLEDAIRLAWDHLHVVPVDQRCLDLAASLARVAAGPAERRDPLRRCAAPPSSDPIRHVRPDAHRRGDGPRLRRRQRVRARRSEFRRALTE